MKRSSARLPNFLIIPNTIACPRAIPSIASRVPPNHPNAYPAAISNGSPGIIAAKTCSAVISTYTTYPQIPCD